MGAPTRTRRPSRSLADQAERSGHAADSLERFSPAVRDWFASSFEAPTPAQAEGWAAISAGHHTLIHAPTGSGKTLAAFLWCLDRLARNPSPPTPRGQVGHVRVLYISPLKALTYDVERNLKAPLTGIGLAAQRLGDPAPTITVASRTGDTPADDRRQIARHPPDILITTPESLYLMLTSAAREVLRGVEHVIIDEVHAIAGSKRGAHLALSLERLERLRAPDAVPPQRIGLSATQRPLDAIARFMAGVGPGREVRIVDAGTRKPLDLQVVVPVDDMAALGQVLPPDQQPGGPATSPDLRTSIWPAIHPAILELIRAHRSTIVFVNSRRLAERLAQRLNELAGEELVRAHHGSIAREQRLAIEEELKSGRLPALVATSSLELGIDMGAVDLVIQVESPTSVARGLQRVGRAGHQVGAPSKGVIFPKYRGDLLECAVVTRRMHEGAIETTVIPRNPLDVLAQQIVAMTVMDPWSVDELLGVVNRAAPYETLTREVLEGVLGMLAGAYPSDEFAELKPRVIWDRVTDVVDGPARRPGGRGHQRRDDPGPRDVRRVHGRGGRHARPAGGRARRGDGLRASGGDARGRRRPRRQLLAGRGDRARPGHRQPGSGRARQAAVLARGRRRPADRARARARRLRRRDRGGPRARREGKDGRGDPPPRAPRPRRARRREPPGLPRGRARRDRGPADRPAGRGRAVPRRARRLAALRADPVRRAGPRALVAGPRGAHRRATRDGGADDLVRRRDRHPAARRAMRRWTGSRPCSSRIRTSSRTWSSASWPARRSSPAASARTRHGRCCCPGGDPAPGRHSGSSASGRRTCSRSPRATAASRSSSRRTASACRMPSTCPPCARSWPASRGGRSPSIRSRRRPLRRSPAACCSTTSRPTCTTATRRSPSAGPAR